MSPPSEEPPAEERASSRSARAHVLVTDELDGETFVHPVVSPGFASYGPEADALAEQALFLKELFARSPPEEVSRMSLPDGARLHEVRVALPREDVPRRLRADVPVGFACVVIPAAPAKPAGDVWVIVPRIGHTFYVEAGEPLDEAIRSEIRRVTGAQELDTWEALGLLPGREHRLEIIDVPIDAAERAGGAGALHKRLADKARRKRAVETLTAIATPLHVTTRGREPPPLVGRDPELAWLSSLLDGAERLSVLLVGPEQAGKSALVRAYLERSARLVYATSGAQLIAGMSGFGQWQERIREVMEAAELLDAVLYFENLEDLLAERSERGGADISGAMRPFLDEGKVRVLAELRPERIDALEGRHWGLFASLSRIRVEPLPAAVTLLALERRAAHDARVEPRRPRVAAAALPVLVDLAERYLPYGAFPGKAVRLYEDLRAAHERAASFGAPPLLGKPELYQVFSLATGVPELLLRDDAALRIEDVAAALSRRIIGQERAVRALAETVGVIKAGLQPAGKPLATFLFIGPTGVGKTELARALAEFLFRSPDRMVRFDMSEFMSADAAERLIRGSDRADGLLTRRVREQPFCVLLLDEIEKAHPAVFDLLLQVCGEGRLTDARGRTAYFHNAILIMTSNLGAASLRAPTGFGSVAAPDEVHYQRLVNGAFRAEFVNRLDRIVPFRSLSRPEIEKVARLAVERVRARRGLAEAGVALEVSEAALACIAEDGYSELYGARALRRHVDEHVAGPLARLLARLGGEAKELVADVTARSEPEKRGEGIVAASAEAGSLRFEVRRKKSQKAAQQAYGYDEIARLRREVDRWMRLSPVLQVKEQIDFLVTQLSLSRKEKADRRIAQETAELSAEHHRLSALWERVKQAQEDARAVEEIAMLALFEGQEVVPFVEDARAAHRSFRGVLPHAMTALEPEREAITLMLEELDEGALGSFLPPLFRDFARRGWAVLLHLDGGAREAEDRWPADRRWGPPRTPDQVLRAFAEDRGSRCVLLRCKGPWAGVLLALEAGLHRIHGAKAKSEKQGKGEEDGRSHVYLRTVVFRFDLPDDAWTHAALAPHPASTTGTRRRGPVARERRPAPEGVVLVAGKRAKVEMQPDEYWERLEEIALEHLLLFEEEGSGLDRDEVFALTGELA